MTRPDWFERPLPGWRYAAIGIGLGAIKTLVDWQVARYFGHAYSLLFYVSPLDAPLMHPSADRPYFTTLAAITVPFVAMGIAVTLRRLRDAAMSPWFALLFFAPFANLFFFLTMCLLPSRERPLSIAVAEEGGVYRELGAPRVAPPPPPIKRYPRAVAAVSGAVAGLGAFAISVGLLKEYGTALLVGTPTIAGFITGAVLARLDPEARAGSVILTGLLAEVIMVFTVIAFAIEGIVCIWLILPVFLVPTLIGTALGFTATRGMSRQRANAAVTTVALSFLALLAADHVNPLPPIDERPVVTQLDVDAPPERVWALLPTMETMPPPRAWGFRLGIAYPVRATMHGSGVGATRTCEFSSGPAVETIDRWEPGRALGFTIQEQPEPMRELTIYRTVRQPHNDGYVKSERGEFTLEPLPGGRTRLTGTSWYSLRLAPTSYWRAWCDLFIHQIHERVLGVVKARAEAPTGALFVSR